MELEENTAQIYPARMWANQEWEVRKAEADKQTNRFGIARETDYFGSSRQQTSRQTQQQQESVEAMRQGLGLGNLAGQLSSAAGYLGLLGQGSQGGQWSNGQGGSISPGRVQQLYGHVLTPYETQEIFAYPQIFFIGGEEAAKIPGTDSRAANLGFDDTSGFYNFVTHDHIAYRYEVLRVLFSHRDFWA